MHNIMNLTVPYTIYDIIIFRGPWAGSSQSRSFLCDLTSKQLADQMCNDQAMSNMSSFLAPPSSSSIGGGEISWNPKINGAEPDLI